MPFITTYGLGVSLQTTKPAGISSSNSTTDDEVLDESRFTQHWQPSKGMTHPIYTSTVLSPQASTKSLRTPFKIVVEFNPDEEMPAYMRGDVRVEALVDGIPCGLRVLREVKFRGKGFRVEFGGFRVGRTEERALVFNKLPKHLQKPLPGKKDSDEDDFDDDRIPNLGAPWTDKQLAVVTPVLMTLE